MKQFKWNTYVFYDDRGRRLSLFANPLENGTEVTVLACSKKDIFSKKEAKRRYSEGEGNVYSLSTNDFRSFFDDCLSKYTILLESEFTVTKGDGKLLSLTSRKAKNGDETVNVKILSAIEKNDYLCA